MFESVSFAYCRNKFNEINRDSMKVELNNDTPSWKPCLTTSLDVDWMKVKSVQILFFQWNIYVIMQTNKSKEEEKNTNLHLKSPRWRAFEFNISFSYWKRIFSFYQRIRLSLSLLFFLSLWFNTDVNHGLWSNPPQLRLSNLTMTMKSFSKRVEDRSCRMKNPSTKIIILLRFLYGSFHQLSTHIRKAITNRWDIFLLLLFSSSYNKTKANTKLTNIYI